MCMFFNNSNEMQKRPFHILLGGKKSLHLQEGAKNYYKKFVTLFIVICLQNGVSMQSIKRPCSHLLSFISNNYSKCLNNVEHSLLWFLIKKIYYREKYTKKDAFTTQMVYCLTNAVFADQLKNHLKYQSVSRCIFNLSAVG